MVQESNCPSDSERAGETVFIQMIIAPMLVVLQYSLTLSFFKEMKAVETEQRKMWGSGFKRPGTDWRLTNAMNQTAKAVMLLGCLCVTTETVQGTVEPWTDWIEKSPWVYCSIMSSIFSWGSIGWFYAAQVLFWIIRLIVSFKDTPHKVSSSTIRVMVVVFTVTILYSFVFVGFHFANNVCAQRVRVIDWNPTSRKQLFTCHLRKDAEWMYTVLMANVLVVVVAFSLVTTYMFLWRLRSVFFSEGREQWKREIANLDKDKRGLKAKSLRTIKKSAILAIANVLTTFTVLIVALSFGNVTYFLARFDVYFSSYFVFCLYKFGDEHYKCVEWLCTCGNRCIPNLEADILNAVESVERMQSSLTSSIRLSTVRVKNRLPSILEAEGSNELIVASNPLRSDSMEVFSISQRSKSTLTSMPIGCIREDKEEEHKERTGYMQAVPSFSDVLDSSVQKL